MKRKLISNDIKKLVQSALNSGVEPVKFELEQFTRIAVGDVYITKLKGEKPIMHITEHFSNEYAKLWNNDVGKILMKELRGDENNLYEIKTDTFSALIKLITKDELDEFKSKEFNHVKIGDNEYTIIKVVSKKKHYSDKTDDYDVEFEIEEANNPEIINLDNDDEDDYLEDKEPKSNSYALF